MAIYFVQIGGDGPVKVGWSRNVDKRVAALQTACPYPLVTLAIIDSDDPRDEVRLHEYLAGARIQGEWFNPSGEVLHIGPVVSAGEATIDDFISERCCLDSDGLHWRQ